MPTGISNPLPLWSGTVFLTEEPRGRRGRDAGDAGSFHPDSSADASTGTRADGTWGDNQGGCSCRAAGPSRGKAPGFRLLIGLFR